MKYIQKYELFENTMKKAQQDFVDKKLIDFDDFAIIVSNDPSPRKKYVYWISKMSIKNKPLQHLYDLVNWFDKNQKKMDVDKRDINKLTIQSIEEMQKDPKFMSKRDKKELQKSKENYKIIYEDSKGNKVVEILNHFGCTYWTQLKTDKLDPVSWCIGSYDNKKTFDNYTKNYDPKKNGIYVIILPNEKPTYRKMAVLPSPHGYYFTNADNTEMHYETEYYVIADGVSKEIHSDMVDPVYEIAKKYSFIRNNLKNFKTQMSIYDKSAKITKKIEKLVKTLVKEFPKYAKENFKSIDDIMIDFSNANMLYDPSLYTVLVSLVPFGTMRGSFLPTAFRGFVKDNDLYVGNTPIGMHHPDHPRKGKYVKPKLIVKNVYSAKPSSIFSALELDESKK